MKELNASYDIKALTVSEYVYVTHTSLRHPELVLVNTIARSDGGPIHLGIMVFLQTKVRNAHDARRLWIGWNIILK